MSCCGFRTVDGQSQSKMGAAFSGIPDEFDISPVGDGILFCDGQPQTGAPDMALGCVVPLVKRLEYPAAITILNTRAGICHIDLRPVFMI